MFEAISQGQIGIEFDGVDNTAEPIARSNPNSDASGKVVEPTRAQPAVQADAPVVRTDNEALGSLLDVFA